MQDVTPPRELAPGTRVIVEHEGPGTIVGPSDLSGFDDGVLVRIASDGVIVSCAAAQVRSDD